ncbi:acyl-CoA thioesterase [Desulfococcaceae bacterium HSG8]|nr:acyl-CoA thioesterase [Desulfococcaceae bacterium HSG8]
MTVRRKKNGYFERIAGAPEPLTVRLKRWVNFSEADVMGIAWHGRYPEYFEEAWAELGRYCGLSYTDFYEADLRAPIVQFHIDYHQPLMLGEKFTVSASMIWSQGARLNTEYTLIKKDNTIATTGYTVQMFIEGTTNEICITTPELLGKCRRRWEAGEFKCLQ